MAALDVDITCRPLALADLDTCLALSAGAGWNQLREDWALFLNLHPGGCFVALAGERLAGTVTAIDYDGRFSWIGMMLVHPDLRRRGIGTLLMNAAMTALASCETIKLDATPAGRTLYAQLGFVDEYDLGRLIAPRPTWPAAPGEPAVVTRVHPADLDEMAAFDAPVFGVPRRRVLQAWYERTPDAAFLVRRDGRLAGYALGRPGANFATIGPVIAATEADARSLVRAVAQSFGDRPLGIDSPVRHGSFRAWLESGGFVFQRPLTRMARGPNRWPGLPDQQWAVLGPEVG
jgi:GNAT superfamily N-acetyltransferase